MGKNDFDRWQCYLTFDRRGIVAMTRGRPGLKSGQFCVNVRLRVPPATFTDEPPAATIDVPARAIIAPIVSVESPGSGEEGRG